MFSHNFAYSLEDTQFIESIFTNLKAKEGVRVAKKGIKDYRSKNYTLASSHFINAVQKFELASLEESDPQLKSVIELNKRISWYNLANSYYRLSEHVEKEKNLKRALDLYSYIRSLPKLTHLKKKQEDKYKNNLRDVNANLEVAQNKYKKFIEAQKNTEKHHGNSTQNHQANPQKELLDYRKALEKNLKEDPNSIFKMFQLGKNYFENQEYDEAKTFFLEVVNRYAKLINPTHMEKIAVSGASLNLAKIFLEEKNAEQALNYIKYAKAFDLDWGDDLKRTDILIQNFWKKYLERRKKQEELLAKIRDKARFLDEKDKENAKQNEERELSKLNSSSQSAMGRLLKMRSHATENSKQASKENTQIILQEKKEYTNILELENKLNEKIKKLKKAQAPKTSKKLWKDSEEWESKQAAQSKGKRGNESSLLSRYNITFKDHNTSPYSKGSKDNDIKFYFNPISTNNLYKTQSSNLQRKNNAKWALPPLNASHKFDKSHVDEKVQVKKVIAEFQTGLRSVKLPREPGMILDPDSLKFNDLESFDKYYLIQDKFGNTSIAFESPLKKDLKIFYKLRGINKHDKTEYNPYLSSDEEKLIESPDPTALEFLDPIMKTEVDDEVKAKAIEAYVVNSLYEANNINVAEYLSPGKTTLSSQEKHDRLTNIKQQNKESLPKNILGKGMDCDCYAEYAMALLRHYGIPSRIVFGYQDSEHSGVVYNKDQFNDNGTRVGGHNKHAWVEYYYKGEWRSINPTPPSSSIERELTQLQYQKLLLQKRKTSQKNKILEKEAKISKPKPDILIAFDLDKKGIHKISELNKLINDYKLLNDTGEPSKNTLKHELVEIIKKEIENLSSIDDPTLLRALIDYVNGLIYQLGINFKEDPNDDLLILLKKIEKASSRLPKSVETPTMEVLTESLGYQILRIDENIYLHKKNSYEYKRIPVDELNKYEPYIGAYVSDDGKNYYITLSDKKLKKHYILYNDKIIRTLGNSFPRITYFGPKSDEKSDQWHPVYTVLEENRNKINFYNESKLIKEFELPNLPIGHLSTLSNLGKGKGYLSFDGVFNRKSFSRIYEAHEGIPQKHLPNFDNGDSFEFKSYKDKAYLIFGKESGDDYKYYISDLNGREKELPQHYSSYDKTLSGKPIKENLIFYDPYELIYFKLDPDSLTLRRLTRKEEMPEESSKTRHLIKIKKINSNDNTGRLYNLIGNGYVIVERKFGKDNEKLIRYKDGSFLGEKKRYLSMSNNSALNHWFYDGREREVVNIKTDSKGYITSYKTKLSLSDEESIEASATNNKSFGTQLDNGDFIFEIYNKSTEVVTLYKNAVPVSSYHDFDAKFKGFSYKLKYRVTKIGNYYVEDNRKYNSTKSFNGYKYKSKSEIPSNINETESPEIRTKSLKYMFIHSPKSFTKEIHSIQKNIEEQPRKANSEEASYAFRNILAHKGKTGGDSSEYRVSAKLSLPMIRNFINELPYSEIRPSQISEFLSLMLTDVLDTDDKNIANKNNVDLIFNKIKPILITHKSNASRKVIDPKKEKIIRKWYKKYTYTALANPENFKLVKYFMSLVNKHSNTSTYLK